MCSRGNTRSVPPEIADPRSWNGERTRCRSGHQVAVGSQAVEVEPGQALQRQHRCGEVTCPGSVDPHRSVAAAFEEVHEIAQRQRVVVVTWQQRIEIDHVAPGTGREVRDRIRPADRIAGQIAERIDTRATCQRIGFLPANENVVVVAASKTVVACSADQRIVAVASVERVVP